MLCHTAQNFHLLCSNYAQPQFFSNKFASSRKKSLKCTKQKRLTYSIGKVSCLIVYYRVTDCSIGVYRLFSVIYNLISKVLDLYKQGIIQAQEFCLLLILCWPASCSIFSGIYYAQNYTSIIGGSLTIQG